MALIFALSSMPSGDEPHGFLYVLSRKTAHFCEYALLLALWWRALATKVNERRALVLALAITLLYAISDELHQTLVSGRSGTAARCGIDMAGALVASTFIARKRLKARSPRMSPFESMRRLPTESYRPMVVFAQTRLALSLVAVILPAAFGFPFGGALGSSRPAWRCRGAC